MLLLLLSQICILHRFLLCLLRLSFEFVRLKFGFVPRRFQDCWSVEKLLSPSSWVTFSTVRLLLLRTRKTNNYSTCTWYPGT